MEIFFDADPRSVARLQKRAEAVVYHGRLRDEPWADGACETDIFATLDLWDTNGFIGSLKWKGTYVFLGAGRGYIDLGPIGQWRLGHELSTTREVALPHAGCVPKFANYRWKDVSRISIRHLVDPGVVAYITDHLVGVLR